jgi:type VI secretion system Hcp family effector
MAMPFYVKVEAATQGLLAGDSQQKQGSQAGESKPNPRADWMEGVAFRFSMAQSVDQATELPTGRYQQAISFVKRWGKSSPQLFNALIHNELLPTVTFEFVTVSDSTNEERVFQRVTVKQANITSIHQSLLEAAPTAGGDGTETEEVALAFRQVTIENVVGSTLATDSSSPTIGDSWSNAAGGGTNSGGGTTQERSTKLTVLPSGAAPRILSVASTTPQLAPSTPPGTKSRQPTPVGQEQIQRPANLVLPKWGRLGSGGGETLG